MLPLLGQDDKHDAEYCKQLEKDACRFHRGLFKAGDFTRQMKKQAYQTKQRLRHSPSDGAGPLRIGLCVGH
jgi:hypothetical protein